MTCRRSCAPRGFAASRRCRTPSRTSPSSTNWPPKPASIRSNIACAICNDPRAIDLVNAVARTRRLEPPPALEGAHAPTAISCAAAASPTRSMSIASFPGFGAAWSAWVADVAVNKATGDVSVTRVVAGQDPGLMINPDGVRHQIHGNVIQSTSRALMEEVSFERNAVDQPANGAPIRSSPSPRCPTSTC